MLSREIVVCERCNVVLMRDGVRVEDRPSTICSHLHGGTYRALPPDARVDYTACSERVLADLGLTDERRKDSRP